MTGVAMAGVAVVEAESSERGGERECVRVIYIYIYIERERKTREREK